MLHYPNEKTRTCLRESVKRTLGQSYFDTVIFQSRNFNETVKDSGGDLFCRAQWQTKAPNSFSYFLFLILLCHIILCWVNSIVYALIVTIYIDRDQKWKDIPPVIVDVVCIVPRAILIVGAANLFGWIMNYEKMDTVLLKLLFSFTTNKYIILIIINIILLVMGMFLEVISAIMLFLPILHPIMEALQIHPIHLGVVMVLNQMIGLLTPPVGFVLYMLSIVSDVPVQQVIRYVIPWIIPLIISLFIITFVPDLVMFLPRLLGFA